jgi:hypothetical protein
MSPPFPRNSRPLPHMVHSPVARPFARPPEHSSVPGSADARLVQELVVKHINLAHRKTNTMSAYDPKAKEYEAFCDHAFSYMPRSSRYTVDGDKMFSFLFYHAMRDKYTVGGRNRGAHGFSGADYDAVWQKYTPLVGILRANDGNCPTEVQNNFPEPQNPLGYDQLNTYKAVVRGIHAEQVEANANSLGFEFVLTPKCKGLLKMVKERRARIKKANCAEKLEGDFSPYNSIGAFDSIEHKFWEKGKRSFRAAFCEMRNRCTFLSCYSGLLRHESMFLGELSDMVGIEHHKERDPHSIFVMVMQIATGKSVAVCFYIVLVDC